MAMVSGIRVKRGQPQIYAQLCYTGVPIFHPALKLSAQPERGPLITAGNCHYNPHLRLSPSLLPPSLSLSLLSAPPFSAANVSMYSPYSKSTVSSSASIPPDFIRLWFFFISRLGLDTRPKDVINQSIGRVATAQAWNPALLFHRYWQLWIEKRPIHGYVNALHARVTRRDKI